MPGEPHRPIPLCTLPKDCIAGEAMGNRWTSESPKLLWWPGQCQAPYCSSVGGKQLRNKAWRKQKDPDGTAVSSLHRRETGTGKISAETGAYSSRYPEKWEGAFGMNSPGHEILAWVPSPAHNTLNYSPRKTSRLSCGSPSLTGSWIDRQGRVSRGQARPWRCETELCSSTRQSGRGRDPLPALGTGPSLPLQQRQLWHSSAGPV